MEAMMAISVMIQRTFSDKEKAAKLAPLIVKLRSMATIQPGYITGKTFRCLDCPGEYLVISTWNSLAGCQFQKTTTGFVFEHVQRPFGSLFDLAYTFSPFKAFGFFGSVPLSNQQE
jgi:heme-degrading monooxygenase HmoA